MPHPSLPSSPVVVWPTEGCKSRRWPHRARADLLMKQPPAPDEAVARQLDVWRLSRGYWLPVLSIGNRTFDQEGVVVRRGRHRGSRRLEVAPGQLWPSSWSHRCSFMKRAAPTAISKYYQATHQPSSNASISLACPITLLGERHMASRLWTTRTSCGPSALVSGGREDEDHGGPGEGVDSKAIQAHQGLLILQTGHPHHHRH